MVKTSRKKKVEWWQTQMYKELRLPLKEKRKKQREARKQKKGHFAKKFEDWIAGRGPEPSNSSRRKHLKRMRELRD
jgi:hypothetical protein